MPNQQQNGKALSENSQVPSSSSSRYQTTQEGYELVMDFIKKYPEMDSTSNQKMQSVSNQRKKGFRHS